jgi:LmbE family N-acetylglucosaminyl deacetylase
LLAGGLGAWVVRELWFSGGPAPDHVVDVTDAWPKKVAALRAHTSQTAHYDLEGALRSRMADTAEAAGLPAGRVAEAFTVLRTE